LKLRYFVLLLFPALLLAAGDGTGKTDIVPRLINFIIFAGILYYLIAKPLKDYYNGRTDEIANRLTSIQDKLKESKLKKEQAKQSLKDASESAIDIIESGRKEAILLTNKIEDNLKNDLDNLKKSYDDRILIEEKKMTRSVVAEVVDEIFDGEKVQLKNSDFLNIIKKKVA